ncbi:hypothetical protein J6590_053443 [Homalodisca vitripennis]|nr:hypothetical protein J6590_053443 [Homalodisca vitripennis]
MFLKPIRWLLHGVGIAPACTPYDKYFTGAALAAITPTIVYQLMSWKEPSDSTLKNLLKFSMCTYLLTPLVSIIHSYICRESYKSILTDLSSVDDELKTETIRVQKWLVSLITLFLVLASFSGFPYGEVILMTLSRLIFNSAFACPSLQHIIFVAVVHSKFSALNLHLETLSSEVNTTPLQTTSARVTSVFRLHTHLHVVVWDINTYFCLYNLFSVSARLSFVILQMYGYLMDISEGSTHVHVSILVATIGVVALFLIQCLMCHACAEEANRTVMLAHHLLQPETPVHLWEEVGLFSRLALNNKVHFSVGGIFSLDRPFLAKVAMTSLSYLIIAVQLKDVRLSSNVGTNLNGSGYSFTNSTTYENLTTPMTH